MSEHVRFLSSTDNPILVMGQKIMIRGCSHIMSAAGGGGGGKPKDDDC